MAKVKKGETCSEEINKEAARIKILDSEETTEFVNDLSFYIKDYQVHDEEIIKMVQRAGEKHLKVSSNSVFWEQRNSDAKRLLLDTRDHGVPDSPLFRRS